MIGFVAADLVRAKELFEQNQPRDSMRKRHIRERKRFVRAAQHRFGQAEASADHERDRTNTARFEHLKMLRKRLGRVPFPADRKRDYRILRIDRGEQTLAFAQLDLLLLRAGQRVRRFFIGNLANFQRRKSREPLLKFGTGLRKIRFLQFSDTADLDRNANSKMPVGRSRSASAICIRSPIPAASSAA